jgi:hypothetical protein
MIDDSPRFILSYTESLNIVLTSGLIFSYFRFFTPLSGLSLSTSQSTLGYLFLKPEYCAGAVALAVSTRESRA